MDSLLIGRAKQFGVDSHMDVNQLYDGKPYGEHLQMVYDYAIKFIHLVPEDKQEIVLASTWLHDTIEDVHSITFNDIKKKFGEEIAEITYALTNEKGRTRKERANDKYYEGIRNRPYATFIKICDRLANVSYSKETGSRMFEVYKKEHLNFVQSLYTEDCGYDIMFTYLAQLLEC